MKTLKATFEQFFDTEAYDSHYNIILLFFSFFFQIKFLVHQHNFPKARNTKGTSGSKEGKTP